MRVLLSLIVIVYLVGVGVALAPVIEARWSSASAADLTVGIIHELPAAVAWPARAYHKIVDRD